MLEKWCFAQIDPQAQLVFMHCVLEKWCFAQIDPQAQLVFMSYNAFHFASCT